MKWSVVGLVALGLVAAGSAALLVDLMMKRADAVPPALPDPEKPCEELIAVATKDLRQNDTVQAADVAMESVRCDEVPVDAYHSSASIVGRMLALSLSEGQAVTTASLRPELSLDAALPKGMRLFCMSLTAAQAGLIYPGAIVDVHVATTESNGTDGRQAVSRVAVERAEVLGVDNETLLSPRDDKEEEKTRTGRNDRQRLVTLKVTTQQAKVLQAMLNSGSVWLVVRNPLDTASVEKEKDCDIRVCRGGSCTRVRVDCMDDSIQQPKLGSLTDDSAPEAGHGPVIGAGK